MEATIPLTPYGLPHPTLRPGQAETIEWLFALPGTVAVVNAPTGCHRAGQGILLANGDIKPVESVEVGDVLMGPDSRARYVERLIRGVGQMYIVQPVKGESFVVNEDHVLTLVRTCQGSPEELLRKRLRDRSGELVDVTVREWLGWSKAQKHIHKLIRVAVDFAPADDLPIDPHFLGVLLGDGQMKTGKLNVTTPEPELVTEINAVAAERQLDVRSYQQTRWDGSVNLASTYAITNSSRKPHSMSQALRQLGLWGTASATKFIPAVYKTASRADRLALLAGLLDTDGYLGSNCFDFISKSPRLAADIAFVARSVGLAAYVTECEKTDQFGQGGIYHRVGISGHVDMIPCRVPRKQGHPRQQVKDVLRTGFTVQPLGLEPFYGFTLDGDGRYLLDNFTVTHNSGKTSFAAAMASRKRVLALVKTKNLQSENYGGSYEFDVLYGRSNYDCPHPEALQGATAAECMYAGAMWECEFADYCEYLQTRNLVSKSYRASLNYSYWLAAKWPKDKLAASHGYLFCDEAHQLSDVVLDYTSIVVTMAERINWDLPPFPVIRGRATPAEIENAIDWLSDAFSSMTRAIAAIDPKGAATDDELLEKQADAGAVKLPDAQMRKLRKAKALRAKISAVVEALDENAAHWYLRSGPGTRDVGGMREPAFVARPLTARYHFPRYFLHDDWKTVMMSATIGDPQTFAQELGLGDGWVYRDIPNAWAPETRPVRVLAAPAMGQKNRDDVAAQDEHARVIAEAVLDCPHDWSGFIHVTRKTEAVALAARLGRRGLGGRLWTPNPEDGTEKTQAAWAATKQRTRGAIAVTWNMWEGIDGREEKICIVAKTPFPSLGDDYEHERMAFDGAMYLQRTAWQMEQGLGRSRRGNAGDYDTPDERRGLVAIADGNYTRVKKYLSAGLQAALVVD